MSSVSCPSPRCKDLNLDGGKALVNHILTFHRNQPNFIIKCPDCDKGGLKPKGFESHWRRNHLSQHHHPPLRQSQSSAPTPSTSSAIPSIIESASHDISSQEPPPIDLSQSSPSSSNDFTNEPSGGIASELSQFPISYPAFEETVTIDCLDVNPQDNSQFQSPFDKGNVSEDRGEFFAARKKVASQFLLALRANCNVNDTNVIKVMKETQTLINFVFDSAVKKLTELKTVNEKNVLQVKREVCNVFSDLHSNHLQKNYFKNTLKVVEPRCVDLRNVFKKKGEGSKRRITIEAHQFYYIPVLEVLENLLAHPDYEKMTAKWESDDPDVLDCYLKGSRAKKNEILQLHSDALRIIVYYDEVELATGLGSHASNQQKLAAFYTTLENIHPKYRASLKCICLLGLLNYAYFSEDPERYTNIVLKRITEDLEKLEKGHIMNGKLVHGTLIAMIGDHAGVHLVGGLKRGFTALRFCRWCNLVLDETHVCIKSDPANRRTIAEYESQVQVLESAKTLKHRDTKSTEYGLNWRCALNSLNSFHVINGCPPDLMHTFFEGSLARAVRRIIIHCVSTLNVVTLPWLNSVLEDFDYGHSESANKPSPIKEAHLESDGRLHQSSAQLWTLAVVLPVILGSLVEEDDDHWINFSQILEITRITHSADIHRRTLPYLKNVVAQYLRGHIELYGHLPAKEHFFIHLDELIEEFGTLLTYSCMRMEANHKLFKKWIHLVNNYTNAPKHLALRYQLNQAVHFTRSLIKPAEYGKVTRVSVADLPYGSKLHGAQEVVIVKSLKIDGFHFKDENCYVCIGVSDQACPVFAKVINMIVFPETLLVCKKVSFVHFDVHTSAYNIDGLEDSFVFYQPSRVIGKRVYHSYSVDRSTYIVMKECAMNSF